ncbi:MAG: hypothetical protein WD512_20980, partial [Candidatus Paceibacterota bacterium]
VDEARLITKNLLEAVKKIHDKKIYHLDIKPINIMIRPNGLPVLIDFGIGCKYGVDTNTDVTCSKGTGGTEIYMTHERKECAFVSGDCTEEDLQNADIYALALSLLESFSDFEIPGELDKRDQKIAALNPVYYKKDAGLNKVLQLALTKGGQVSANTLLQVLAETSPQISAQPNVGLPKTPPKPIPQTPPKIQPNVAQLDMPLLNVVPKIPSRTPPVLPPKILSDLSIAQNVAKQALEPKPEVPKQVPKQAAKQVPLELEVLKQVPISLSGYDMKLCLKGPSQGGIAVQDLKKIAQSMGINIAGMLKADLCKAIESQL